MRAIRNHACLVAVLLGSAATAAHAQSTAALNRSRALSAYSAMQGAYYASPSGLYRDRQGLPFANLWPYSQAMAATISVAAIPGLHSHYRGDLQVRLRGLEAYADRQDPAPAGYMSYPGAPHGNGGARYNDDNEWVGIELIRLFHLDGSPALLTAAAGQLNFVFSQWDSTPGIGCPGGVLWQTLTPGTTRNTVSNATGAELGAQLYMRTHNATYLTEAAQMYSWVRGCLLDSDGLYGDHVDDGNGIDSTEWTYNQGTMIGAGVMLYQATKQVAYLQQAEATAQAGLADFSPQELAQQPVSFDAIYVRNLLLLGAASGDPRYAKFAAWFAEDEWSNVRDPDSGLFNADGGGATQLIDQAALVQVYAMLASPPRTYF